jgi:hypothetical protein
MKTLFVVVLNYLFSLAGFSGEKVNGITSILRKLRAVECRGFKSLFCYVSLGSS